MTGTYQWTCALLLAGVVATGAGIASVEKAAVAKSRIPAPTRVTPPLGGLDEVLETVDFEDFRFNTVLNYLRRISSSNIRADWAEIEAVGIDRATPVKLELQNVPAGEVLRQVLAQVSSKVDPSKALTFIVTSDNVVRIAPRDVLYKALPATYAAMPEGLSSFGAVSDGGWLYVYGGHLGKTHTYSATGVSDKFNRLNLTDGKTWEELPSGPVLQGMNLVGYKRKIYRVGGMQPKNKAGEKSDNYSLADAASYDPATKKWEALPPLPVPRSSHDVAIIGSKLYVIGGWTQLGGQAKPTWPTDMVVLDLEKVSEGWKSVKQPFIRRAFIAGVLDGKLYIMGGLDQEAKRIQLTEVYDPKTDSWTHGPGFPDGDRNGFAPSAATMDGALYMNMADGSMLKLNAKGDAWEKVGKSEPRIVGRMVSNGDQLLVIGGSSKVGEGRMMNEIEVVKVK